MLVGRNQRAETVVERIGEVLVDPPVSEELDLTFYESVNQIQPPALDFPPVSVSAVQQDQTTQVASPSTDPTLTLQIGALRDEDNAARLREDVSAMGFPVFVIRPDPGDTSGLYRIHVGPFIEGDIPDIKTQLEAAGYKPIVRRK